MTHWRRLSGAMVALVVLLLAGTVGYVLLGFTWLNAAYQAVNTVSTVGFREVEPLSPAGQVFTMVLILFGVGAALYAFKVLTETFIEGQLNELLGRRRMDQSIASMHDHVIVCGWGRVGRSIGEELVKAGRRLVVVEREEAVAADAPLVVLGDATEDGVLRDAGIEHAAALVAATDTDAANAFIALGARALNPGLFIVARTRHEDSADKLHRSGADRVVNPHSIGGARMAAFVVRPHVSEFLDVVMHDEDLEFRLEEVPVTESSPIVGRILHQTRIREQTGALVLALRDEQGSFQTNPDPDTEVRPGQVIIAIGTQEELNALVALTAG